MATLFFAFTIAPIDNQSQQLAAADHFRPIVQNGKLTDKGLAELREKMTHTDLTEFEKDPDINKLADLFTVGAIINYVENKLNAA